MAEVGGPRILIWDVEVAPIIGTVWGKYEQNLIWEIQGWYFLCFAYKWLGEKKTYVISQRDMPNYKAGSDDDSDVIRKIRALFDEADIVIAHNGDAFDQKKANARMAYWDMSPPSPYKQIDTLKVARRYFKFTSNKLGDLGQHLGLGNKLETGGHELWKGCMAGDIKSWEKMEAYNKQDVVLLEQVYLRLRPWMTNHPPIGIMGDRPASCDNCGSSKMHNHSKKTYAKRGWRQQYKCYDCGSYKLGSVLNKVETKENWLE